MREGHHDTDRRAALAAVKDSTVALLWRKEEKISSAYIYIYFFLASGRKPFSVRISITML